MSGASGELRAGSILATRPEEPTRGVEAGRGRDPDPALGFWRASLALEREDSTSGAIAEGAPCPHCRERATLALAGERAWCAACGGTVRASGQPEAVCPECALTHAPDRPRWRRCAGAPPPIAGQSVPDETWLEAIGGRCAVGPLGSAERYVASVRAAVDDASAGPILMSEDPEPFALTLPGGTLVLSRGVLVTLEDEAQLAFLFAREGALVRRDRIRRRCAAAVLAARPAPWAFFRGTDGEGLADALELSRSVGFGPESEHLVDRDALGAMVAAEYDPQSGPRALALLGAASREGGRYKVSRVRSRLLGRWLVEVGRPVVARINREVYSRAIRELRHTAR